MSNWFWSSGPKPAAIPPDSAPSPTAPSFPSVPHDDTQEYSQPPSSSLPEGLQPPNSLKASRQTSSRQDVVEAELAAAFPEVTTSDPQAPTTRTVSSTAPSSSPRPRLLSPLTEQSLPTTMSCRQAFDAAYHCATLGGKFNDIYRYGKMQPCSEHWSSFWFCMRLKSYTDEEKEEMIKEHYREKERKKYYGRGKRSSENVWQERRPGEWEARRNLVLEMERRHGRLDRETSEEAKESAKLRDANEKALYLEMLDKARRGG